MEDNAAFSWQNEKSDGPRTSQVLAEAAYASGRVDCSVAFVTVISALPRPGDPSVRSRNIVSNG